MVGVKSHSFLINLDVGSSDITIRTHEESADLS